MNYPIQKACQTSTIEQTTITSIYSQIRDNRKQKYNNKPTFSFSSKNKFKTQACKYWLNDIECPFQSRCNFAHGEQEKRLKQYLPTKYKTRLCQKFNQESYCPYGSRCRFVHLLKNPKILHSTALQCLTQDSDRFFSFLEVKDRIFGQAHRLVFFQQICQQIKDEGSTNAGTVSEEDRINEQQYLVVNTEGIRSRQGSC